MKLAIVALMVIPTGCSTLGVARPPAATPPQPSDTEIFNRKLKCAELGRAFVKSEFSDPGPRAYYLASKFHYSQKLNTCLLSGGLIAKGFQTYFTIDLATNQWIADFQSSEPHPTTAPEFRAYEEKRKVLMDEMPVDDPLRIRK